MIENNLAALTDKKLKKKTALGVRSTLSEDLEITPYQGVNPNNE
jgi:hypothetical protein